MDISQSRGMENSAAPNQTLNHDEQGMDMTFTGEHHMYGTPETQIRMNESETTLSNTNKNS